MDKEVMVLQAQPALPQPRRRLAVQGLVEQVENMVEVFRVQTRTMEELFVLFGEKVEHSQVQT
jgi:hypothetical protein